MFLLNHFHSVLSIKISFLSIYNELFWVSNIILLSLSKFNFCFFPCISWLYFNTKFLLIIIIFFPWAKLSVSRLLINISFSFFLSLSFFFFSPSFFLSKFNFISGGSKGSKLLYPNISLVSQSTIIFPGYSSISSFVGSVLDKTPKIYELGISSTSRFSLGTTVIQLWCHLNGKINFKKVLMIKCNKYAWDAEKIICFSVNIENNILIIIDWSKIKNNIFISVSFLLQGISQFELK